MFEGLKKNLILKSIEKKKANSKFDINMADLYVLPHDAPSEMNNSHYFVLFSFDSKETLFLRLGLRGGDYDDEVWLTYRDKNGNVYLAENDHIKKGEEIPALVTCLKAGKKLSFRYKGNVIKAKKGERGYEIDKNEKPIPVKIKGEFIGESAVFEFMYHLSAETLATALAKEKLKNLKGFQKIQQVHYEQAGKSSVTIIGLEDKPTELKDFHCVRDHSYGVREWSYMDRYIWSIAVLENGEFIHTSLIRYPVIKELPAGFLINGEDMVSLKSATQMDTLPILGTVPENFCLQTAYVDGQKRNIESKLDFVVPYYFRGGFNVNEGVADFVVDGMRAKGISEFGFNADKNRWVR